MMELRDYQVECLDAIKSRREADVRRQLAALPTGTGKSVIFTRVHRHLGFGPQQRVLLLAHREELIDQAARHFRAADPDRAVGVEMADQRANSAETVVASVQTICRRLDAFDPAEFPLVIVDEAHHAAAPTYREILDRFGFGDRNVPDGRLLVGFTATPKRGDGVGLHQVFDEITFQRTLREMIAARWLVDIAAFMVQTIADIAGVETRHGDFAEGQLAERVNVPVRNNQIAQTYLERAARRKAIAFAVNVKHAEDLAAAFREAGVRAEAVSGGSPDRSEIVARYRAGEIEVITNCNLLTEGFDDPATDCILMARPTKSGLLYEQMIGRGTRLHPGKDNLLVFDFVDNCGRHDLVTLPTLFGLNVKLDLKGRKAAELAEKVERADFRALDFTDIGALERRIEARVETRVQSVDLFKAPSLPEDLKRLTRLAWIETRDGMYRLSLPERRSLSIVTNLLGQFEVLRFDDGFTTRAGVYASPDLAFAAADRLVNPEERRVASADAPWRRVPATEKQLETIRKCKLRHWPGMTKGEASAVISEFLGSRRRAPQRAA